MVEIRWTEQAAEDLEAIAEFIANDSPHYASIFCIDILAAVERLVVFPDRGRVVPEWSNPNVRELILGNYRIIYRRREDVVEILSVYHSSRLLDPEILKNSE
jgi:toxin ParE1/3/4